mgnify:CR=1 FL=1
MAGLTNQNTNLRLFTSLCIRVRDILSESIQFLQNTFKQSRSVFTAASPFGQLLIVIENLSQLIFYYIEDSITELNINTNAFNEAGGGRGAYGIAQWRGPRQDGLDAYAKSRGKRRDNLEIQLGWLVQEMKTSHKDALSALKATSNSADATTAILDKFERPSAADRNSSLKKRISYGMAAERGTSLSTAQSTYEEPAALAAQARGASSDATGFSIESALDMAKKIFGKAGGALIGTKNYTSRPITQDIADPSTKIQDMSKKIETAMINGKEEKISAPGAVAATATQKSIMQASNDGSLGALDPNYPGGKDLIMTYLAHWKFAA